MILRSLTKHVNEQNWFAVGLEMAVLVLGIIIGLQFSNWNEERLELIKGQSYLERIADELDQDIRFFDGVLRSNNRSIEDALFLIDTINNKDLVREDPTRFITSLTSVGASIVVNISNNTIEEIKFSGKLELIADEELRNEIVDYYDFIEVSQTFNHLRLNAEIEYQRRNVGVVGTEQYGRSNRGVTFDETEALLVYERFIENQELRDWIPVIIGSKRSTIRFSTRSQSNAKELVALIRGEPIEEEDGEIPSSAN